MDIEFHFCTMRSSGDWLYNNVSILNLRMVKMVNLGFVIFTIKFFKGGNKVQKNKSY